MVHSSDATHLSSVNLLPATWTRGLRPEIPGYEIQTLLGSGGMGIIYRARHLGLDRVVALKTIRSSLQFDEVERQRFFAEARAAARLQHPLIVQMFDVGEHEGVPYCAMELMPGGNLSDKLGGRPQPPREAAALVEQLAGGVQAAHDAGILHRDLKPNNIFLGVDGLPKIGDFGLAKLLDSTDDLTTAGSLVGTPAYMAPEQTIAARSALGVGVDIYGLGVILYEMLTGHVPFVSVAPLDLIEQVRHHEPVAPMLLQPSVPLDLNTICMKCLQKEPHRRYATAQALAEDLRRFREGKPILARPVGPVERLWRWCRRRAELAILGSLMLLLLIAAISGFIAFTCTLYAKNAELVTANEREMGALRSAEERFQLARKAVERTSVRLAEHPRLLESDFTDLRQALLAEMLPFYDELARLASADNYLAADRGHAYARLAYLHGEIGDWPMARRYARLALETATHLVARHPEQLAYRWSLAQRHFDAGNYAKADADPKAAEAHYRQALGEFESLLVQSSVIPTERRILASVRNNLGTLLHQQGRWQEAITELQQAQRMLTELTRRWPREQEFRADLARAHLNLGVLYRQLRRPSQAAGEFQTALALRIDLRKENPEQVHFAIDLARLRIQMGDFLLTLRQATEAEQELRQACEVLEALQVKWPSHPRYCRELANGRNNYGNVLTVLQKLPEAEAQHRLALALRDKLAAEFPANSTYTVDVASSLMNIGNLLANTGRAAEGLTAYSRAVTLLDAVTRQNPKDNKAQALLSQARRSQRLIEGMLPGSPQKRKASAGESPDSRTPRSPETAPRSENTKATDLPPSKWILPSFPNPRANT